MTPQYFAILANDALVAWNRFWFDPTSTKNLDRVRISVGLIATFYALSWLPDLAGWIQASGPLNREVSATLLDQQGSMTFFRSITAMRPSLLYSLSSPFAIQLYLMATVASSILLSLGIGGRWIATSTWILVLGIVHRVPSLTGIAEPLLTAILAYLVVDTGRAFSWKPGMGDAQTTISKNVALRLIQIHLWAWLMMSFFSQQASLIWWQGEAVWYFATSKRSLVFDTSALVNHPYWTNLCTHAITFVQCLAVPGLLFARTRPMAWLLLMVFWSMIALMAGEWMYALVGAAGSFAFFGTEVDKKSDYQ